MSETEVVDVGQQTAEGRCHLQFGAVLAMAGAVLLIVGLPLPWATLQLLGKSQTWSGMQAGAGPRYLVFAGLTALFAVLVQLGRRGRIPLLVVALLTTFATVSEIVTLQDMGGGGWAGVRVRFGLYVVGVGAVAVLAGSLMVRHPQRRADQIEGTR